jgi:hypothetical protein
MDVSDLTLSIIIICIFMLLFIFNFLVVNIQRIKENWPVYRCQPLVMPFASFFGHNTAKNFAFCIQTMQKGFMDDLLKPVNFNVGILSDVTSKLSVDMNYARNLMAYFRLTAIEMFKNIFSSMFNMMVEVQRVLIVTKDTIGKMVGNMTALLHIVNGSLMTMNSMWNGPPGGLVRAICFHPDTTLELLNGELVRMKDAPLNGLMENNTRILSIMHLSNLDENGDLIEKMYRIKRKRIFSNKDVNNENGYRDDIIVSGTHLIYDPRIKTFIKAQDCSYAELTDIRCETLTCLITSNHTIPIGGWIFHDWEDNNGSPSKSL